MCKSIPDAVQDKTSLLVRLVVLLLVSPGFMCFEITETATRWGTARLSNLRGELTCTIKPCRVFDVTRLRWNELMRGFYFCVYQHIASVEWCEECKSSILISRERLASKGDREFETLLARAGWTHLGNGIARFGRRGTGWILKRGSLKILLSWSTTRETLQLRWNAKRTQSNAQEHVHCGAHRAATYVSLRPLPFCSELLYIA
jgi:hypothetical protein